MTMPHYTPKRAISIIMVAVALIVLAAPVSAQQCPNGLRSVGYERILDYAGLDLTCASMRGANLIREDLNLADLSGADLTGARLSLASLLSANLETADLSGASLDRADLTGAIITEIIDITGDGAGNPLDRPLGITVDGSDGVYVVGSFSNNAFKITPKGHLYPHLRYSTIQI